MSTSNTTVSANGDIVYWSPQICNTGTDDCPSGKGVLTIPAGLELVYRGSNDASPTPVYSVGQFNQPTVTWYVGEILDGECQTINFEFIVTDILLGNYTVTFLASSSCVEDTSDNTALLEIEVVAPFCVDLKIGATPGTTVST